MEITLCSVGGYNEVGKNMTALKIGDEVIILDMGVFVPKLIDFEEEGSRQSASANELVRYGAIPDDSIISSWKNLVKAIAVTHCHIDHCAAIPYLSSKYNAPIYGTPFSVAFIKSLLSDEKKTIKNKLKVLNPGSIVKVSKNISIEFINTTHSTLQTVMIAVHTPEGVILYSNDFKFDNHPVLGKAPDYVRLKKIAKEGVLALIVDSLYAPDASKTPSEKVAREMLKDVMLGTDNSGHAIIVTTFASHLARLRSIVDFGKKLNRKVVFLGRSMAKYSAAGDAAGLVNYSKEAGIFGYRNQVKKVLKDVEKNRDRYVVVCTGNQGEPKAVLSRMAIKELPFKFLPDDHIIFSCKTIPVDINIANRALLESRLKKNKVRIFKDIHVSGHAAREDLRDLIDMVKPQNILPAHGNPNQTTALAELAVEMGYKIGKEIHLMNDGQMLKLK